MRPITRLRRAIAVAAVIMLGTCSSALAYQFFLSAELKTTLEKQVGKQVRVCDELVKIWDQQEVEGYLRFDTTNFRCAIPTSETEGIAYLRELMKRRAEVEKTSDGRPALIMINGTVQQPSFWGKPREGKGAGVAEDQIVIVADKVEKPRQRFFDEGH